MPDAVNPALSASLEELKKTAQSLQDLDEWFTAHPQALTGELQLPENYEVEVNISYMPGRFIGHITATSTLPLTLTLTISAPKNTDVLMAKELQNCEWVSARYFKHTYTLDLALTDWALAAAWAAGLCLREGPQVKVFDDAVAAGLAVHFPQTPLKVLQDMRDLELLPLTDAGKVDVSSFIEMLFTSKNSTTNDVIPMDIV